MTTSRITSYDNNNNNEFFVDCSESEIKVNLNRIQETELKLGDMISNHIKRKGPEEFLESRFVVTNR